VDELKVGDFCPLLQKDCIGLKCKWYAQVRGKNPQTNADIDHWGCAITWLPLMLVEGSMQMRRACAAVESFRDEVVQRHDEVVRAQTISNQAPMITVNGGEHDRRD